MQKLSNMFVVIASSFDANALLHTALQTDEIKTEFVPIPEGDWEVQFKTPKISSGEKDGKIWARLECAVTITDPQVAVDMGMEGQELGSTYQIFLDMDQDTKGLAFGVNKNVRLGQLFEAVGLHGEEASIADIEGKVAIANFKHSKTTNGNVRSEISKGCAAD